MIIKQQGKMQIGSMLLDAEIEYEIKEQPFQKGFQYQWTDDKGQIRTSIYWSDDAEEDMADLRKHVDRYKHDLQNHPIHISHVVQGSISPIADETHQLPERLN